MVCSECNGTGKVEELIGDEDESVEVECQICEGTGEVEE